MTQLVLGNERWAGVPCWLPSDLGLKFLMFFLLAARHMTGSTGLRMNDKLKYRSARESQVPGAKAVAYFCHELRTPMFYVERNTFKAPDHSCTDLENEEQVLLLSTPKHSHRMAVAVSTPTFCMLRRSSDVLMLPSANLNLSRFITDSSPAFALIGGTLSP